MTLYPAFPDKITAVRRLGGNEYNVVYDVTTFHEQLVAKCVLPGWRNFPCLFMPHLWALEDEADVAAALHTAGISVPQPRGMYALTFSTSDYGLLEEFPGFVMVKSCGKRYWDLPEHLQDRARKLYQAEISKAERLGFISGDTHCENYLYLPASDSVELLDFAAWHRS